MSNNMRLIISALMLCFVSSCLCLRLNVGTTNTQYNVMDYGARGDGKSDDSQPFLTAWKNTCGAEGTTTLVIPQGKSFMIANLNLSGPCKATNIHIQIEGQIVAPSKEALKDKMHWIRIQNLNGLTVDGNGQIDGYGSTWWQCETCTRPTAVSFHSCNNLTVSNLRFTNSPKGHITLNNCDGATLSHISIDSPATSPNTDGIDISVSKNILIQDSTIKSGDDCIAINGGCSNINATRVACGPGHGISIGSLGRNQAYETVEKVHVQNCSFIGTSNGARIKTFPGGSGYAKGIIFEQIQLTDVKNPIIIDQHYGLNKSAKSAVQVSEVTYRGFNGTSSSDIAINMDCSTMGCFSILLDQIYIVSSQPGKKTGAICRNAHGVVQSSFPWAKLDL